MAESMSDQRGRIDQRMARMERNLKEKNDEIRARDHCLVCEHEVPERDFETKYAAAGGALAGPFCGSKCYWRWMNDE